ncbi:MAG: right-handed parallel beta-helix repeat-containing protein [Planctomycetota bacterium]|nr:right-handed parallel beta-helix repeat-containing protein [Planctomycetota bacterium]
MNGGQDYYVNDTDTAGDLFTTAMGNNLNSGKSPDRPMASLAALIDAYDLDAGDVVHVDNGSYAVVRNISLGSQDSGVRIEGPALGVAVLNRGNTTTGSYVIELAAADDVTISRLTLTGAVCGVFGSSTSDSDRFTLVDSRIYSNSEYDIALATSNDEAIISRNTVSNGTDLPCIDIHGNRSVVAENDVSGGSTGIYVSANSVTLADQIVVSNNRVHNSRDRAIFGEGQVLIVGNTVWGQTTSTGIEVGPGSKALNNTVFDNKVGIGSSIYNTGTATIEGNRVYRNSQSGMSSIRIQQVSMERLDTTVRIDSQGSSLRTWCMRMPIQEFAWTRAGHKCSTIQCINRSEMLY